MAAKIMVVDEEPSDAAQADDITVFVLRYLGK